MAHKRFFFFFVLVAILSFAKAGENITPQLLAGTWKVSDVKIVPTERPEQTVTKERCYLCDLYKAGLGLVFTVDGKVSYSNYGNPQPVRYSIVNNVLTFFAEKGSDTQHTENSETSTEKTEPPVQFSAFLNNGILTLVYTNGTNTETYTFTK